MKILEQSEHVLTLQNSVWDSIDFWGGLIICLLFVCPLLIMIGIFAGGWWAICFPLGIVFFFSTLKDIWASDETKFCSFNKALSKVTIKYYGLQPKIKDFPLRSVRAVEVRKTTGYAYYMSFEIAHLWLVTWGFGAIRLSKNTNYTVASLEAIANQIREFLSLKNCSM